MDPFRDIPPPPNAPLSAQRGLALGAPPPRSPDLARVLLAEESLSYRRVTREALMAFRNCEVDDCPTGEHAFEMALRRPYDLFIFAIPLPDIHGVLLDRLLSRAYPLAHPGRHTAPPVIFIVRSIDSAAFHEVQRDARVRGSLSYPPKLDALLALTQTLLPERFDGPMAPTAHVP